MQSSDLPLLVRARLLVIISATFIGLVTPIIAKSDAIPDRVIFILSDDHRHDFMGFTGKIPWLETPNMDRMASGGAHFSNAYVTTSLCSPSRATILTGLYAHQHTIVDNQAPNPGGLTYFPEYLQKAGYATAFFGKWHMGDHSDDPQPGCDHWESFKGQGVYYGPLLNINGVHTQYNKNVYTTDLLTEHAIEWMQAQPTNQPYFLYLSHKSVHAEFAPAHRHKGRYSTEAYTLPATFDQTKTGAYSDLKWPEWVQQQRISWHGVDYMYHQNRSLQEQVHNYCETLLGVDDSIGQIMKYLDQAGLTDSTLVIYMGDNGFSWGEHGLIDKRHFYEESGKVPLLMHFPDGIEPKQRIEALVNNTDIAPTILAAANLVPPEHFVGHSIFKVLNSKTPENWRQHIFYEYYWEYDFPMTPTTFGVRDARYKFIRYHGIWDRNELYDLENDPNEMYNLIEDSAQQERIETMAHALYDWLEPTDGMQIPLKRTVKHRWGDYRHEGQH
ncbi:MAG: sulfatase [Verrucomicrobiota bacterium]|nr:sulfatase [Verrucomicrobiota bacterium]